MAMERMRIHPVCRPVDNIAGKVSEWRTVKPVFEKENCTKCRICEVYCPDICITTDAEGYPVINYDACKGCMICMAVCPRGSITEVIDRKEG